MLLCDPYLILTLIKSTFLLNMSFLTGEACPVVRNSLLGHYVTNFSGHCTSQLFPHSAGVLGWCLLPEAEGDVLWTGGADVTIGILTHYEELPHRGGLNSTTLFVGQGFTQLCSGPINEQLPTLVHGLIVGWVPTLLFRKQAATVRPLLKPRVFCEAFQHCSTLGFHPLYPWKEEGKRERKQRRKECSHPSAGTSCSAFVLLIWTFSLETELPLVGQPAGHIEVGGRTQSGRILPNSHLCVSGSKTAVWASGSIWTGAVCSRKWGDRSGRCDWRSDEGNQNDEEGLEILGEHKLNHLREEEQDSYLPFLSLNVLIFKMGI